MGGGGVSPPALSYDGPLCPTTDHHETRIASSKIQGPALLPESWQVNIRPRQRYVAAF